MINKNTQTLFYVVPSPTDSSVYNIHNIYTDAIVAKSLTLSDVFEFLTDNNPTHPMLIRALEPELLAPETPASREEYLKLYTDYYNGYVNPYGVNHIPSNTQYIITANNSKIADHSGYSYVVSDNDVCSKATTNLDDSDSDSEHYGDSNNIPYVIGEIMLP